jgi:hypothetical protein
MPYVNMIYVISASWFFKFMDTGCNNSRKTRAKTLQQYIDSHAGEEVELHL